VTGLERRLAEYVFLPWFLGIHLEQTGCTGLLRTLRSGWGGADHDTVNKVATNGHAEEGPLESGSCASCPTRRLGQPRITRPPHRHHRRELESVPGGDAGECGERVRKMQA